jgi:hypothetical protein
VRTDISAGRKNTIGRKKGAGKSGIGTEITGIARSSFIVGRKISSFLLSGIALSAMGMIGMIEPIGAITTTIGDLMGRLEEERPFTIGWGAGSACMTGLAIVFSIFLGTRKNLRKWLMLGFLMSSYFAEMPILIG